MFVAGLRQTAHPVFLGFRWIMVAAGPPRPDGSPVVASDIPRESDAIPPRGVSTERMAEELAGYLRGLIRLFPSVSNSLGAGRP